MSIADELIKLDSRRDGIVDAIKAKGGSIEDKATLAECASAIGGIPSGDGNVYNYNIFTGHVDRGGLRELGWPEDAINEMQRLVWWNEDEDDDWSVATLGAAAYPVYSIWRAWQDRNNLSIVAACLIASGHNSFYGIFSGCSNLKFTYIDDTGDCSFDSRAGIWHRTVIRGGEKIMPCVYFGGNTEIRSIVLKGVYYNCTQLFRNCTNLDLVDVRQCDMSNVEDFTYFIDNAVNLQEIIGVIDMSSATINLPNFSNNNIIRKMKLKNIGVSISISGCPKLSHESLKYIIENAKAVEGQTMTLGATNLAKLTDEEKQIAIDKGWTLA